MGTIIFSLMLPPFWLMLQHQTAIKTPGTPWLLHSSGITFDFERKGKLSVLHKVCFILDYNFLFSFLWIASLTFSLHVYNPINSRTYYTNAVLPAEEYPSSQAQRPGLRLERASVPPCLPPSCGACSRPGRGTFSALCTCLDLIFCPWGRGMLKKFSYSSLNWNLSSLNT